MINQEQTETEPGIPVSNRRNYIFGALLGMVGVGVVEREILRGFVIVSQVKWLELKQLLLIE